MIISENLELEKSNLLSELEVTKKTIELLPGYKRGEWNKWLENYLTKNGVNCIFLTQYDMPRLKLSYEIGEMDYRIGENGRENYIRKHTEWNDYYLNNRTIADVIESLKGRANGIEVSIKAIDEALSDVEGLENRIKESQRIIEEETKKLNDLDFHVRKAYGLIR